MNSKENDLLMIEASESILLSAYSQTDDANLEKRRKTVLISFVCIFMNLIIISYKTLFEDVCLALIPSMYYYRWCVSG